MNAVAAEARAWLRFLFSLHGWIGRASYLRGVAVILMLNLLLFFAIGLRIGGMPGLLVLFATLPISVAVTTKRLHALMRTGWWQAPARALTSVGLIGIALVGQYGGELSDAFWLPSYFVLGAGLVLDLVLFCWLALARNKPPPPPVEGVFD